MVTGQYINYSPYFPNFFACIREIVAQFSTELAERLPGPGGISDWLYETWEWHYTLFYIDLSQILCHAILIFLGLTVLRLILTKLIFEPFPRLFNILESDAQKFPESAWKAIVYGGMWSWAVYLCLVDEKMYFFYPINQWNDWFPGAAVPPEIYWLYMFQMGFYLHCVYATLFVEVIRKDFAIMMVHHFLTLALLFYSLGVRFHVVGLVVLFIQDFGDVSLEVSKCIVYFKTRNGVDCKITEQISNVSFAVFTVQWVLLRLYWFPTKVLYSSCYVSTQLYPHGPFYLSFNVMLILLYAMQVYWFSFIVRLLIRMVWKGEIEVKDTREIEEEEEKKKWDKAIKEHKRSKKD